VRGTAFQSVDFRLPALRLGRGTLTVGGTALQRDGADGKPLKDRLVRTFDTVESRLTTTAIIDGTVGGDIPSPAGATGLTTHTFTDGGRGALVPLLIGVAERGGMRLDRVVAQSVARRLLIDEFGWAPTSLPDLDLDRSLYRIGDEVESPEGDIPAGLGLLPWSGPDPWLTARIAVTEPDAVQADLRPLLLDIRARDGTKRDLSIAAIAGLAAVGEPVLADLQAARRETDLTTTERLYLALGFAAAGDDASAIEIERELLTRAGERLGPWVRLRGNDLAATASDTALLAVVAGSIGDPLGADMAAYVIANPGTGVVHELELAAYAERALARIPATPASFAYTVDGRRAVVTLEPGQSFSLRLTAAQRADLALETVSGTVAVAVEGRVTIDPSTLTQNPDLKLTRKLPGGGLPTDRIVTVNLTATFSAGAPEGCYMVTELVPSGLAPLAAGGDDGEEDQPEVSWPTSVVGQEVRFCADNDAKHHTARLRYRARVVNAGTFGWEPAVMQLTAAPDLRAVTPAGMVTIGGQ
jgi:hypothetical protein